MTICISARYCENGHCLMVGIFDDTIPDAARAARCLIDRRLAQRGHMLCMTCLSGVLHDDTGPTICDSLEEVALILRPDASKHRDGLDVRTYVNREACNLFCGKTYHGACLLEECPRRTPNDGGEEK